VTGRRLALLATALLVSDGLLYFGLRVVDTSRIFYDRSAAVSPHRLYYWSRTSFDAELGWDLGRESKNNLGAARHHGDYPAQERYKLKAFGDSFIFGSDVGDDQVWSAVIERETGWTCLNYGVPGYGPDQALLKYQRTPVASEWTVLGIQQENIARLVNIYRAFYMEDWGPPKPRFFLDGEGLRLEPNPVPRPEDARRLLDPKFVDRLRTLDYWPGYNDRVLGAPRRLDWPATWTLLRHAPFFMKRAALEVRVRVRPTYEDEVQRLKPYHLYDESSEAFQLLCRVIDRFLAVCAERGERPLVVVFPIQHTVDLMMRYRRCVYEPLARRLRDRGTPHIDFGQVFAGEHYPAYYLQYNGHLSPEGNERVARQIIHYLRR
jgi:hypothetical protein